LVHAEALSSLLARLGSCTCAVGHGPASIDEILKKVEKISGDIVMIDNHIFKQVTQKELL
jgi:hypothetical protein